MRYEFSQVLLIICFRAPCRGVAHCKARICINAPCGSSVLFVAPLFRVCGARLSAKSSRCLSQVFKNLQARRDSTFNVAPPVMHTRVPGYPRRASRGHSAPRTTPPPAVIIRSVPPHDTPMGVVLHMTQGFVIFGDNYFFQAAVRAFFKSIKSSLLVARLGSSLVALLSFHHHHTTPGGRSQPSVWRPM